MPQNRFRSLNTALQERFGEKIYKLSLNGGCTCPNRDRDPGNQRLHLLQRRWFRGFCFQPCPFDNGADRGREKAPGRETPVQRYIAYFQAYTNTYAPIEHLRMIFTEAITHPDVAVLSVATRPDCLGPDVLELLYELNQIKPVWVELGLQTIHEETAALIRRGYPLPVFDEAMEHLKAIGVETVVHAILGLPGETPDMILDTVRYINTSGADGIKLQLLHILKDTDLAAYYKDAGFHVLTLDEYVDLVIRCLEISRPDLVIHRLTGDGPKDLLIAPLWSQAKRQVLNTIHRELKNRDTYQGRLYTP